MTGPGKCYAISDGDRQDDPFMFDKNVNVHIKEHTSKFFEGSYDGSYFFFQCSIILM